MIKRKTFNGVVIERLSCCVFITLERFDIGNA